MKKYNIKVNGSLYQVEVEEVTAWSGQSKAAPQSQPEGLHQQTGGAGGHKHHSDKGPTNVHDAVMTVLGPGSDNFGKPPQSHPESADSTQITAPMPGKILDVRISAGQRVNAGDILIILEAMKMENEILAPAAGTVISVNAYVGASVNAGELLVVLE